MNARVLEGKDIDIPVLAAELLTLQEHLILWLCDRAGHQWIEFSLREIRHLLPEV